VEAAAEEEEEDRIGLLVLCENMLHFYSGKAFSSASNNGCWQWRHDDEVTLVDSYEWVFGGAADQGYAVLQGVPSDEYKTWLYCDPAMGRKTNAHCFTVELQTLVVEQLCVKDFYNDPAFLFASFPPPFAPPSI